MSPIYPPVLTCTVGSAAAVNTKLSQSASDWLQRLVIQAFWVCDPKASGHVAEVLWHTFIPFQPLDLINQPEFKEDKVAQV